MTEDDYMLFVARDTITRVESNSASLRQSEEMAEVISMLLEYAEHKGTCPAFEDRFGTCNCGVLVAVNRAIKLGNIETTLMRRWL